MFYMVVLHVGFGQGMICGCNSAMIVVYVVVKLFFFGVLCGVGT